MSNDCRVVCLCDRAFLSISVAPDSPDWLVKYNMVRLYEESGLSNQAVSVR